MSNITDTILINVNHIKHSIKTKHNPIDTVNTCQRHKYN